MKRLITILGITAVFAMSAVSVSMARPSMSVQTNNDIYCYSWMNPETKKCYWICYDEAHQWIYEISCDSK